MSQTDHRPLQLMQIFKLRDSGHGH